VDLITQTVLGAAVGEVTLGKKVGNKAILWGAIGGLIPDLDVLITPFFSDVDGLFVHRGISHSILFPVLFAPLLAWIIHQIHKRKINITFYDWIKLSFLSIFTHPLLDYFTTYGTGAFLPFSGYRVEFSSIAIIDLFYTLPLLLVLMLIAFISRTSTLRRKLINSAVIITTLYLIGTVGNKMYINSVFKQAFTTQSIEFTRYKTVPLPLTNFLWMGIAETEEGYYMALYSNFDNMPPKEFRFISRNDQKLEPYTENEELKRLITFTKGYYHVNEDDNGIYIADLRFGMAGIESEADFIFKFYLKDDNGMLKIEQSNQSRKIEGKAFAAFMQRINGI